MSARNPLARMEEQARRDVAKWNEHNPIGRRVVVQLDNGSRKPSRTRSHAQVVGVRAVVWVEGIVGCYELARVSPFDPQPEAAQ